MFKKLFGHKEAVSNIHFVLGSALDAEFPGLQMAQFGMGCFWGAERKFWTAPGVISTAVGYSGGQLENPTYEQVCDGNTGHAEVVRVVYDPAVTSYEKILDIFWANHNPTQLNRQGNDRGTQYRTAAYYYSDDQRLLLEATKAAFQKRLTAKDFGPIVTEIRQAPTFYFAEEYHQQYLAKNPGGYCGLGGTGCYTPGEVNELAK